MGVPDDNVPQGWQTYCATPGACCNEVRFYRRDTNQPLSQLSLLQTVPRGLLGMVDPTVWGTLELRRISPTLVRSYECASYTATMLRDIINPFSTISVPGLGPFTQYIGPGNGSGDGPVSMRNPGLPHFGGEVRGTVVGKTIYITKPPAQILPMEDIGCPQPPQPVDCRNLFPFGGTLFGEANWPASDPNGEWFFTGAKMWLQTDRFCNPNLTFPAACFEASCGTGTEDRFWRQSTDTSVTKVGWWLIYMTPAGNPPTWSSLNLRWYQITSPTIHDDDRSALGDLQTSQPDPRTVSQVAGSNPPGVPEVFGDTPVLIHGVRSGSQWGYKVFRTRDLLAATHQTCGSGATLQGIGEPLLDVPYHELPTHLEIQNGGCDDDDNCDSSGQDRGSYNAKCHIFPVTRLGGEVRWVTVVAACTVVTKDSTNCAWTAFSRKPMVVFYDVTDTALPSFPAPVLLRVGLGSDAAGPGSAWAVNSKTYDTGQTYVFVTDLRGKLMVFDVTGDTLFNPIAPAVYPPQMSLRPIKTLEFPRDPYDGYPPNVIDVEIDGMIAYCALGRSGVGLVDITTPQFPVLMDILETSGVTEGIAFRTDERGFKQMVAGDLGAGMRLWGRPGQ